MIPADVDIDTLIQRLSASNVYIDNEAKEELQAEQDIKEQEHASDTVQTSSDEEDYSDIADILTAFQQSVDPETSPHIPEALGDTKLVVLGNKDLSLENSRDIAQAIKDATGADTVIIHSAGRPGVVSTELSRYNIENNQLTMSHSLDPATTQHFIDNVAEDGGLLAPVNAVILTGTVAAAALAALSARYPRRKTSPTHAQK